MRHIVFLSILFAFGCEKKVFPAKVQDSKIVSVDSKLFLSHTENVAVKIVDCTLNTGTKTKCYEIETKGIPVDHNAGPFCPKHIHDQKDNGGTWFLKDSLVNVDGSFIKSMADTYHDDFWKMYEDDGKVIKTENKEECDLISRGQLSDELLNHCIDCQLSYISEDYSRTFLIPVTPVKLESPMEIIDFVPGGNGAPPGPPPGGDEERPKGPPPGGGAQVRGIAFNGVVFDAPAPIEIILGGYSIAPLDHAGGHVNPNTGYHYHAATGKTKEVAQADSHEPMIGYAMDGYGIYAHSHAADLDECLGHYDEVRGYHYHADAAGSNNFINCFRGAIAE